MMLFKFYGVSMTFNSLVNFHDFLAWKMTFSNSMTFLVFHEPRLIKLKLPTSPATCLIIFFKQYFLWATTGTFT